MAFNEAPKGIKFNPNGETSQISRARLAIESAGYFLNSIQVVPEGRTHDIFDLVTTDNIRLIARFEKPLSTDSYDGLRRDIQFNGPLSLQREAHLLDIFRDIAKLPSPKVIGLFDNIENPFLLVEHMPGNHWSEFIRENNYAKVPYLRSINQIGKAIAKMHAVKFESFGDILGQNEISPANFDNFADRVGNLTRLKIERALNSHAISDNEAIVVQNYVQSELADLTHLLGAKVSPPCLNMTDLHPMNFFVDNTGTPSAFFDLETCQAGHPSLDIYALRLTFLHYFHDISQATEMSFFQGYYDNGGKYDYKDETNIRLENLLAIGHLLSTTTSYFGVVDGLRDRWSSRFKEIMLSAIRTGVVDYQSVSDQLREKTKQPFYANQ